MQRIVRTALIALLAIATLTACHPLEGYNIGGPPVLVATRDPMVTVNVRNNNWEAVHLYVTYHGAVVRSLGVVDGMGRAQLRLPAKEISEHGIRIVRAVSRDSIDLPEVMSVLETDDVRINIEELLATSTFVVFR